MYRVVDILRRFKNDDYVVCFDDGKKLDIDPRKYMLPAHVGRETIAGIAMQERERIEYGEREQKFGAAWLRSYDAEMLRIRTCPPS